MNIASALKAEMSRIARKEGRGENKALKKSSAQYRSDIAALKRRVAELERLVKNLAKGGKRSRAAAEEPEETGKKFRFSARSIAAQRKRLGLSAADFGALLGVSAQSIYHWEQGKSRPRQSQMAAIQAVRSMGKRQLAAHIAQEG